MHEIFPKRELYDAARRRLGKLLHELSDPVAAMACACAVLYETLPYASWTGFYRVVAPRLLRIGPYQGPVGCLEIPFDSGVCGAAASSRRPQLVADVHSFPGHIACDPLSRSEIVMPVFAPSGELVAVLDLDSRSPAAFDGRDLEGLESITALLSPSFAPIDGDGGG